MDESNPIEMPAESGRPAAKTMTGPPAAAGNPTLGIVAFLLTSYCWMLTALLALGRWLFGGGWPGALRENVSLGVTLSLTLFVGTVGRRHLRAMRRQTRGRGITVNAGQALLVTLLGVAAGAYGTWLCCGS